MALSSVTVGREGGNASYLLFRAITLTITSDDVKDVSLFDGEGKEMLRGTDYQVISVPGDITTIKFDVGPAGKKKTLLGLMVDAV